MRTRYKALILFGIPFLSGLLVGFVIGRSSGRKAAAGARSEAVAETVVTEDRPEPREVLYHCDRPPYSSWFADLNDAHLDAARRYGLKSIPEDRETVNTGSLALVADCEWYIVDTLRYSVPYLTKKAAGELEAIGRAFTDSLKRKGLLDYRLVVSSVLRTEADVEKLRRSGNPNASDNSAHCYGTTFDITYTRYFREDESEEFMQPFELTKVLAEVLRDRKDAGKCLVKYERQEHCFHITAIP